MLIKKNFLKIKKFFSSEYDPNTHWEKWGKQIKSDDVYKKPHKLEMKIKRVNSLLNLLDTIEFKSVLDFGCGWGFVSKYILERYNLEQYVGFDASSERINEAKTYLKNFNVELHCSLVDDFKTDKKFDLVLGTGILHHIKPNCIENSLKHLLQFAKYDFIHDDPPMEYGLDRSIDKTTFNFFHNYNEIWKNLGYDVDTIPIPGHKSRILYHVKVN